MKKVAVGPRTVAIRDFTHSRFVAHAVRLLEGFTGVPLRVAEDGSEEIDIGYGEGAPDSARLRVPLLGKYSAQTVPGPPGPEDYERCLVPGTPFPFDLFSAIRFWLCDEGNQDKPPESFDAHERLMAQATVQWERGLFDVPIVNAYMDLFRSWVCAQTGCQPGPTMVPPGKRCVLVLSHDVDAPIGPGNLLHASRAFGRFMREQPSRWPLHLKRYLGQQMSYARRPFESFWIFDKVMCSEERLGIRSTFLFASASGPGSRYAHPELDVRYSVAGGDFRRLFREMVDRGFEIGLHTSYNARDSWERIRDERLRLSECAGKPVLVNRHHYWHMTRPFWKTLEDHERAGIAVDSSTGFNDAAGYRLGIAYPFRPWIPGAESPVKPLQVPTVLMDHVFFRKEGVPLAQKLERVQAQIDTLKRYGGVASINWHDRTSHPGGKIFGTWGEMYLAVLEMIAADKEIATMSFEETLERAEKLDGMTRAVDAGS